MYKNDAFIKNPLYSEYVLITSFMYMCANAHVRTKKTNIIDYQLPLTYIFK